ncbi:MAG: extracellular solute-binding protein [Rhodothermales bacterium]|nr:extracellular solute-binding protein [Rhodothermales bacterium]
MRLSHILFLLVLLAGCRPDRTASDDGRTPIRLFLLLINSGQVAFFDWAEQEYEARHPDIDLIIEQFPGTSLKDYEIKLRLRYASGQAPDIWSLRENELTTFVDYGLVRPAPDYIAEIVDTQSINDLIRQAPVYNDTLYGIVHHAGWTMLYYNRAHFLEAGLDPDRPPRTWAEVLDYADRLTVRRPDGSLERVGFSLRKVGYKPGTAEKWLSFFYSAGGVPFNEDGTDSYFDSDAGRAAFKFYRDVLDRGYDSVEFEGDQRGFGQGRVSMFIREDHVIDWVLQNYPELDYGVGHIPTLDTTFTSYSSGGAFPFVVSNQSAYPDAAWRFLEFLFEHDVYLRYIELVRAQPNYLSVAQLPRYWDDPYLSVYRTQPVRVPPKFSHDKYSLERIGEYVERFSYGRIGLDETLRRMNEEIDGQLVISE